MRKNNSKNKGFTLIEILVATSIVIIMSAIILPNYNVGGQQLALNRAANKLAQDIRKAEEMAVSVKTCQQCEGSDPAGYGAYFNINNASFYIIYADTQQDGIFNIGQDVVVENIEIEKGIIIKNINNNSSGNASINFSPPDPKVKITYSGSGTELDYITITIAVGNDQTKTRTVVVNKAGLIYVE